MARDVVKDRLSREAAAAAAVLAEIATDDAVLAHDTVEGETGLFEAVEAALAEIDECDVLAEGLSAHIKKMADRKARIDQRAQRLRGAIDQAFHMADVKTHRFPTATITMKRVPEKLVLTGDESDLPAEFFVPQPPKLDKAALLQALKNSREVPGATLSNGGSTIQIRRT